LLEIRFFVSLVFLCLFSVSFPTITYAQTLHDTKENKNNIENISDWKYYQLTKNAITSHYYDLSYTQPLDIDSYCPNYKELDRPNRIEFWIAFLKELATVESQNKPKTIYQEKFIDKEGFYVYSIGLFQLSLESGNGNYKCDIEDYEDLQDPKTNIECTIKIFDKLIQEDNIIRDYRTDKVTNKQEWKGLSRYWGSIRNKMKINKIKFKLSHMDICAQELEFAFRR
jgi:hypothetical protein